MLTLISDHGGDSDPELSAGLFFYSKRELTTRKSISSILEEQAKVLPQAWEPHFLKSPERTVPQIDLVSSLSMLMGISVIY
jgi:phosphatidylinositol glycan class O